MVTITTALTTVIWYGTGTTLSSTAWATKALIVRQVNGSGYSSFDPNPAQASFNTLQSVATGTVLIVESLPSFYAAAGGYQLDNGTAPTATANPVRLIASFPAGGTSPAPLTITLNDQVGTYILDPAFQPSGVTSPTYFNSRLGAVLPPLSMALNDILTITGTTVVGTAGILTLLKQ